MLRLAWQFMRYDRVKSLGALLGGVISIFLIGQQAGVFIFLVTSMSTLVDRTPADLWVVDARSENVNALARLDTRLEREVASVAGVRATYPLVIAGAVARFPDGTNAAVQLVGAAPPSLRGAPATFEVGSRADLLGEGAVAFDRFDRGLFGGADVGGELEVGGRRAVLAARAVGTRGFGASYLFTTLERARALGAVSRDELSAVLVDVEPGVDPAVVRDRIAGIVHGARAWRPRDLAWATRRTLLATSGIALSFGALVGFAVVAGFFIIGLTLYSAAVDRLRDYGTMKAIGARDRVVARLIMTQAAVVALAGYAVGTLLTEVFRLGIASTGVFFAIGLPLRLGFLALTLLISLGGAVFAVRRIAGVEPAAVFRG
jgi:putative ABC transport system permease protein